MCGSLIADGNMDLGVRMRSSRIIGSRLAWLATVAVLMAASLPPDVRAQNPNPNTYYSYDSASTQGWPPTAPYTVYSPTAVVVEGIYASTLSGCTGYDNRYTPAKIESQTVYWLNNGFDVITEITPYNVPGSLVCGTLSDYENVVNSITAYVEAHASTAAPTHWAGIMLDEERTFWSGSYSSVLQTFKSLTSYTHNVMSGTPGMSWYFLENQPNDFTLADTYALYTSGGSAWLAPQVYQQTFLNATNQMCSSYNKCVNMVTINSTLSTSWANYSWVVAQVSGSPWYSSYSTWGSGAGWWNEWRPV